jgi:hypothetical protein
MTSARWFAPPVLAVTLALLTGCGGTDGKPLDMGGEDGSKISAVIEDVNDAVGNPKKLDTLFVKGAKPADPKKFAKCGYTIVGKPTVSGTTATAKVRIDPAGGGQSLGEQEWSFEKDGDKWKIKSAPLP